jgi:hypothetical protein
MFRRIAALVVIGITKSKDDAPEFFGRNDRYAHRLYGGVIINTVR